MGRDDDDAPDPSRASARRGHDTDDTTSGDVRPPSRHRLDEQKLEALLEVLEFSEVDLLNPDSKRAFADRLLRAKRKDDQRKKWRELRMGAVLTILGGITVWLTSQMLPAIFAWARGRI